MTGEQTSGRLRLYYGIGSVAEGTKDTAFSVFLLFYYNNVLGLSGTLAGLAIFLALCVDAVTDPLMGSISDATRSRFGRRHPYMVIAIVPMAVGLIALFAPPAGLEGGGLFAWLLGFAVLVRLAMTAYAVPSNAMLPELTTDYDERTRIVGVRYLFGWLAGLSVATWGYLVPFAAVSGGTDGRLDAAGYADYGVVSAVLAALAIAACAWGTRSVIPHLREPTHTGVSVRRAWRDLRTVFANRGFRLLAISALFSAGGWGYINAVSFYMNTYFWGLSSQQIGVLSLSLFPGLFAAFAIAPFMSTVLDKKSAAVRLSAFAFVFGPAPIFFKLAGAFPANGSREAVTLLFMHTGTLFAALIAVMMITASMIADVTDQTEAATGERHEGVFAALMAFVVKATSGLGTLAAGVVLDVIAFPTGQDVDAVSAAAAQRLGLGVGPLIMVAFAVSLFFLWRYPLRRADYAAIRAELDDRAGQPSVTSAAD